MTYKDFNFGNLLADPVPVTVDTLDPMLGELPWKQMHWESYQKLCAQLIQRQYIGTTTQVFQYGKSGQAQGGIDIIWKTTKASKYSVAEVKHWEAVKPSNIRNWLNAFLDGQLAKDSRVWILCISIEYHHLLEPQQSARAFQRLGTKRTMGC